NDYRHFGIAKFPEGFVSGVTYNDCILFVHNDGLIVSVFSNGLFNGGNRFFILSGIPPIRFDEVDVDRLDVHTIGSSSGCSFFHSRFIRSCRSVSQARRYSTFSNSLLNPVTCFKRISSSSSMPNSRIISASLHPFVNISNTIFAIPRTECLPLARL